MCLVLMLQYGVLLYLKKEIIKMKEDKQLKYEIIPNTLRVEIKSIMDCMLKYAQYEMIVNTLCREYGLPGLTKTVSIDYRRNGYVHLDRNYYVEFTENFLYEDDVKMVLDVIELSFRYMNNELVGNKIGKLNRLFEYYSLGFRFEGDEIIRIDKCYGYKKEG